MLARPFHANEPVRFANRATSRLPMMRRPRVWRYTRTATGLATERVKVKRSPRLNGRAAADLKPGPTLHTIGGAEGSPGVAPGPPSGALFRIRAAETS